MLHRVSAQNQILCTCAHTHPHTHPQLLLWFIMFLCENTRACSLPSKPGIPHEAHVAKRKKYIYTHKVDTIASCLRSVVQFAPGCPLMREPGLPSAPVWSGFPRRSRVSWGWEAMCRSWARTKGLGVMTSQATQAAF